MIKNASPAAKGQKIKNKLRNSVRLWRRQNSNWRQKSGIVKANKKHIFHREEEDGKGQKEGETDRQTGRPTDRWTGGQMGRRTDRSKETPNEVGTKKIGNQEIKKSSEKKKY